jgi:hypothetical protein
MNFSYGSRIAICLQWKVKHERIAFYYGAGIHLGSTGTVQVFLVNDQGFFLAVSLLPDKLHPVRSIVPGILISIKEIE